MKKKEKDRKDETLKNIVDESKKLKQGSEKHPQQLYLRKIEE